jgi:hypothetical protein
MARASIRDRLAKLEDKRRFLDWFATNRFYQTLTGEELETCDPTQGWFPYSASGWGKPNSHAASRSTMGELFAFARLREMEGWQVSKRSSRFLPSRYREGRGAVDRPTRRHDLNQSCDRAWGYGRSELRVGVDRE